jgi:hypothetical protein
VEIRIATVFNGSSSQELYRLDSYSFEVIVAVAIVINYSNCH